MDKLSKVWIPLLRIIAAIAVVYYTSDAPKRPRLFSGLSTAVVAAFLSFTLLQEPLASVGLDLADVALYVLAINAALVGLALGVLLPNSFSGACFGLALLLLGGTFNTSDFSLYFWISGPVLALVGSLVSLRLDLLPMATVLVMGGLVGCLAVQPMCSSLMEIVRGFHFVPPPVLDMQDISTVLEAYEVGLAWIASSFLVGASIFYYNGASGFTLIRASSQSAPPKPKPMKPTTKPAYQRDGPSAVPDAYNMFDPADLPPRLAEYANMVYSACEDLGNFFGFQDSSVRNQAEHLLILLSNNRRYMSSHILPPSVQPPSPIHALHAKVFSNYMKWCRAMGVPPNFSKMNASMSAPPPVASRVVDLVLFFCIWGEGANIRHMPECMWFLYHKMMEEYTGSEGYTQTRSLYAGHFIDNIVAPIYEIVATNMKSKADHPDKRNYDDFNEFFWSRRCLTFSYSSEEREKNVPGMGERPFGQTLPPITEGLVAAPKTFLEKRSWLRGILALSRIVEWHIATFYLLVVTAFARELVWGWVYFLQVASGVFWVLNSLHLGWGLLEVWASYPGIKLTGTAVCGSFFTLIARYLILVYQTLYITWAFSPRMTTHLGIDEDATFWFWQYIWLSLLCMIPYLFDSFIQMIPSLSTSLYTSQNVYVQSFLNILFPLSRIYTGKEVHESFQHAAVYMFYWGTLIVWKLFFSYVFEVYSMVLPSLEMVDDYMNYPDQSFMKMALLLILRWSPQFVVYIIDMSIWYAAWQAVAGTTVGFSEHLGDIRSIDDIRQNFGQAPENFCKKMLSPDAGSRRGSSASFLGGSSSNNIPNSEGASLLGTDPHRLQSYVNRLLDVRIQKWVMFSAAWNEIIDYFRQEDIVSTSESDNLKFSRFDGFSQAIYLPVFQTAGVIDNVLSEIERPLDDLPIVTDEILFKPISGHVTMLTAVSEVWELGSFVFLQLLGSVHNDDFSTVMNTILKWSENGCLTSYVKLESMRTVMNHFVGLISILEKGIGKRKASAMPRSRNTVKPKSVAPKPVTSGGMRRAVSATSLSSIETDTKQEKKKTASAKSGREQPSEVFLDALRDQVRDKLRNMFHAIKGILKNSAVDAECRDVLDRITFLLSMENGFLWDNAYASDQLDDVSKNITFKAVLKKIHGLVACHPDDVEPKSKEVRRRLTFFVNSLFMDMPDAPSIHDMFSWNVLTPYYSEDVTYTKGDLEKRSDALGVSTLLYLQTLYRADWNNFMERLGITNEENIWSKKFINETRRWASIRAQTLSRTVNGMMYSEKALRLLANLERLDEETTNDLLGEKFGYIVSCQVYGNMKRNQDPKADDIEQLMHQFPHLRVAYIDNMRLNRSGASVFHSVLVKSDGRGSIQEIYRVRLPGNPVIGEGKPENQNHAMIFTRGEFLQTIDMNQEGYFEEALKMRNCLQEFAKREGPLPTTILGLREHIFTGSVSSLANYMALQETSFVTLGQRVLTKPLCIRLHYGHPDIFDKLFFITRGGISKSSKGINLSEDIFAGYNNAIRGGSVGFKEYVQVGKGRDVGMSQIYKFEAKLSQGAAEQSLSRDVYRLSHRLDFSRLLSYYYGGIGHYFSNVLTILTVYIVVYLMAALAIYDMEKIGERKITPMGTIQMLLGGLGLLQTIPLFATLGVERGWWESFREIVHVFVTGGPFHFMFHIQTKANYMAQTILVGGAKYRATGRGFVTQHTPFDEQFRFFSASHLYLGVELAAGLVLVAIFSSAGQYAGRTWSLWLASLSFLASPFWFNPLTFDWNVVTSDYEIWLRWMRGTSGGPQKSWSMWWTDENSFYSKMPLTSKSLFVIKATLFVLLGEGIRRSEFMMSDPYLNKPAISVGKVLIFIIAFLALGWVFTAKERTLPYPVRRTLGILISVCLVAGIVTVFMEDTDCIRYTMATYYFVGAVCQLGLLAGVKQVKHFYMIHDLVCGHIIFVPLFVLGALQLPRHIQTWLLYHNALSTDVVVSDILRYARKTQETGGSRGSAENEDLVEQVTELRKLVQKQEQMLASVSFVEGGAAGASASSGGAGQAKSTTASSSNTPSAGQNQTASIVRPAAESGLKYNRALSLSGLDVWGTMAFGDLGMNDPQAGVSGVDTSQQQSQSSSTSQGFSFTQPDTMPPR